MKMHFYSISDNAKIKFITDYEIQNENTYVFEDKSIPNTTFAIEIKNDNEIVVERVGDTNMLINLRKNEKTRGTYSNSLGLNFEFEAFCKEIIVTNDKVTIEYDFIFDENEPENYKIYLLIK